MQTHCMTSHIQTIIRSPCRSQSPIRRRRGSRSRSRSRSRTPPLYLRTALQVPASRGFGGPIPFRRPPAPPPAFLVNNRSLDPDVRMHFISLYDQGLVRPGDLGPACINFLQGLPLGASASVLDEFASLDHSRYRQNHTCQHVTFNFQHSDVRLIILHLCSPC